MESVTTENEVAKEKFSRLIDAILDGVDNPGNPAILNPSFLDSGLDEHLERGALDSAAMVMAKKAFYDRLELLEERCPEIDWEGVMYTLEWSGEVTGQVFGFAQGLRAGGLSRSEAARHLRGFLRLLEDGERWDDVNQSTRRAFGELPRRDEQGKVL